jgi:Lon protease-like protein
MISECLSRAGNFGVIRALEAGMAEVGCTAEIVAVTKEYPDGRLDIVTEGRKRFEVLQLDEKRSFIQAEIVFIEDEPDQPSEELAARAAELHAELLNMAGAVQDLAAADRETLSFYLAGSLPLDLDFKQTLLASRRESLRLSALIRYLEALLPKLRRSAHVREKASGNGHGR